MNASAAGADPAPAVVAPQDTSQALAGQSDADAVATESPSALAQVLPVTAAPDLGTQGTLMLVPDSSHASASASTSPPALPAAAQPIVPCGVGWIAYSSGAILARNAHARGSITCFGAGVRATIRPTVDWFNTPLFDPFRHAPKKIATRGFGQPYFVADNTNRGMVRHRVARLCVLISGDGYLPAFGCFYAPFGPLDLPLDGGGV
ncbi:MAG: hypothetical protein ACR2KV_14650 [Solirubrobacteraceae bacterium]